MFLEYVNSVKAHHGVNLELVHFVVFIAYVNKMLSVKKKIGMNDIPGKGESVSKGLEESTMWYVENYRWSDAVGA